MNRLDPIAVELEGTHLVEASAGTGKTTTIALLVLRLVAELDVEIRRILVVTYTRPATAELRLRIRARLRDAVRAIDAGAPDSDGPLVALVAKWRTAGLASVARRRLESALAGFDEAPIHTIHAFCQHVLEEHAFESGAPFGAELVPEQKPFERELVLDLWERALAARPPAVARALAVSLDERKLRAVVQSALAKRRARLEPDDDAAPLDDGTLEAASSERRRRPLVAAECVRVLRFVAEEARRLARERKEAANVQSFDDLLYELEEALARDAAGGGVLVRGVRARYGAALIDEFQDTDPVQLEIFRRLFAGRTPFFVIGDPKQSIFAFQGADLEAYVRARRELAPVQHGLGSNWRSDAGLVAALNALFRGHRRPFASEAIGYDPVVAELPDRARGLGRPLRFVFVERAGRTGKSGTITKDAWSDERLPEAVAAEVERLLGCGAEIEGRPLATGDVAIVCRTNARLRQIRERLRERGIPAVIQGATSVFDDPEAEEMERIVAALADPADARAIRAALATSLVGRSGDELFALGEDDARFDVESDRFRAGHEAWLARGFAAAFRTLLEETDALARLARRVGGERSLTNFLHLAELVQNADAASRGGPVARLEWFRRMREDAEVRGELGEEAAQVRLESDEQAVKLVTIHRAKGLEWPIVVCPDLWLGAELRGADKTFPRRHVTTPGGRRELVIDLSAPPRREATAAATLECYEENLRLFYVAVTRARHQCTIFWGGFRGAERSALHHLLHLGDVDAEGAALLRAADERFAALDDAGMLAALEVLVRRSGRKIGVERLVEQGVLGWRRPAPPPPVLAARSFTGRIRDDWRSSSFTALVRSGATLSRLDEEGRDREQATEEVTAPASDAERGGRQVALDAFPAGPNAGNFLHALLERLDFAADAAAIRTLAEALLPRFGLALEWAGPVAAALEAMLATPLPLPGGALALRDVGAERRRSEMGFVLPVARLDPRALGRTFERHRVPDDDPAYGKRLARLEFEAFAGFLGGAIDLVFEHGGRWWVLDWKSNHLGPFAEQYGRESLAAEMVARDYVLQLHLYAVALDRHLALRLPGYDYERDFGGVIELFLRGVAPDHPRGTGIVVERPSRAFVEELSALLGRVRGAA